MIEEATHILLDPGHMIAEVVSHLIIETVLLGIAVPFIKRAVRRHDRIHHS